MTGRAAGYGAGYPMPGYANPHVHGGRGGRGGRGGGGGGGGYGHGRRHQYWATGLPGWARAAGSPPWEVYAYTPYAAWPPPDVGGRDDAEALRKQAGYLEEALEEVRSRLGELEAGSSD